MRIYRVPMRLKVLYGPNRLPSLLGFRSTCRSPTTTAFTDARVPYGSSGVLVDSANLTFDGTSIRAGGYKSSDGSAGLTQTVDPTHSRA